MSKAIALLSGGLDSVTLAYHLAAQGRTLHLLSFDYGQRHKQELEYAAKCAAALSAQHDIIDLSAITPLLSGSALTDDIAVPEGHYAAPNMRVTVVPNRNAIMLAVAYAAAVAEGASLVATGVHAGDHPFTPIAGRSSLRHLTVWSDSPRTATRPTGCACTRRSST